MTFYAKKQRWLAVLFVLLVYLPSLASERVVQTVEAFAYTLPEQDPFLAPFQGTDLQGVEDVVSEIKACREPWRKEAEARIQAHRKHDLYLQIMQSDGSPYGGENIRIRQLRHAFDFGVVLKKPFFSELDALENHVGKRVSSHEWGFDLEERFKLVNQFATQVGFANALKYKLSADKDPTHMIETVIPRLRSMGMSVRGHTLIWPGWKHMHADALALKEEPDALRAFCTEQIKSYARQWDVDEWDVINEPRVNQDIQDILGRDCMVDWFKTAQAHVRNVDTGLYLNDYKVISKDEKPWNEKNIEHYQETVEWLLAEGAPLTHLGFQSRFHAPVDPQVIYERLEQFRKYDLPMKATEFEIRDHKDHVFTELERARMTADMMTIWFSHSLVNGIVAWTFFDIEGFVDERSDLPRAFSLLYENRIKLNGKIWLYLMRNHWHTDVVKKTSPTGTLSLSGFLGDYEVLVRDGDQIKRGLLTLDEDAYVYKVQL
jgi:GH35 family endo-1,4-beta-xylanase